MIQVIETEHLEGRPFVAAGNEGFSRYPNLVELHDYYPCGEPAMRDHAGIEPELLHAVLYKGERLEYAEIMGLAKLYGCPMGVLLCQKVIMLDTKKPKHRKMVFEVDDLYTQLKCMAREGNQEAKFWSELDDWVHQRVLKAAHTNSLSYCHYLGAREEFRQHIYRSTLSPKRRGLSPMKGGVV